MQINIATATGNARAWIYAVWSCGGYNPCDTVFWGVYRNGNGGPGDKGWGIILPSIIAKLGDSIDIPDNIVN